MTIGRKYPALGASLARLARPIALSAVVASFAAAAASAASAQVAVETYTGVVGGPHTIDAAGLFGAPDGNLAGDPFSVTYVTNEDSPYAACYVTPNQTTCGNDARRPFMSAFLTIDGATLAITANPGAIVLGGHSTAYGGTYSNSLNYAYEPFGGINIYNSLIASGIPVTTDLTTPIGFSTAENARFTGPYQGIGPGGENDIYFNNAAGYYPMDLEVQTLTIGGSSLYPVTPTSIAPDGAYAFADPVSGEFYDPPTTGSFDYRLTGGGDFTAVGAPPVGDGFGPVDVVVGGAVVATLNPGDIYAFGSGVNSFQIAGISPAVPTGRSNAFPTFLEFSGSPAGLTMTPGSVPEPAAWALMLVGVGAIGGRLRSRRGLSTGVRVHASFAKLAKPMTATAAVSALFAAGAASATDYSYAFLNYGGDGFTAIRGVDNNGVVAGVYLDANGAANGFTESGGAYTTIDYPNAGGTRLRGINDLGTVVGNSSSSFSESGGVFTVISPPGAISTFSSGINDAGAIVGDYDDGAMVHGFEDVNNVFTTIDPPGSVSTLATGVNSSGEIVGYYTDASGGGGGFTDVGGVFTTIDVPGATYSGILGVNDSGILVGFYGLANGDELPFIDNGGAIAELYIPGQTVDTDATGIDDSGVIVGYNTLADGSVEGFIATPAGVPEPASWALMLVGVGAVGGWRRRRRGAVVDGRPLTP